MIEQHDRVAVGHRELAAREEALRVAADVIDSDDRPRSVLGEHEALGFSVNSDWMRSDASLSGDRCRPHGPNPQAP